MFELFSLCVLTLRDSAKTYRVVCEEILRVGFPFHLVGVGRSDSIEITIVKDDLVLGDGRLGLRVIQGLDLAMSPTSLKSHQRR